MKILDFYMDNCVPCNQLKEELKDYNNVEYIKSSENLELVLKYSIRKAPTLIFIKDNNEVGRLLGFKTNSEIDQFISTLI